MPTVARIAGVKIQLYAQEHPPPHFHAVIAEHRAQIDIETLEIMRGSLPHSKLAPVLSWASTRRAALKQAWEMTITKRKPGRIE